MKSAMFVFVLVAFAVMTAHAQESKPAAAPFTRATVEQTEKSLINALESNSEGLQISAALTVRELKTMMPERSFSSLVIPLMRIVKDDNASSASRVIAAIALSDLHSAMGDYAISRETNFTGDAALKHACSWLAYNRTIEDHPELAKKVKGDNTRAVAANAK